MKQGPKVQKALGGSFECSFDIAINVSNAALRQVAKYLEKRSQNSKFDCPLRALF